MCAMKYYSVNSRTVLLWKCMVDETFCHKSSQEWTVHQIISLRWWNVDKL